MLYMDEASALHASRTCVPLWTRLMPGIAAKTAPRLQLDNRMQMRADEFKRSWSALQGRNRQQQWG